MAVLGGILGAIAGFVVGVVIHVAFWNDAGWADILPFALAVAGGLAEQLSALGLANLRRAEEYFSLCKCLQPEISFALISSSSAHSESRPRRLANPTGRNGDPSRDPDSWDRLTLPALDVPRRECARQPTGRPNTSLS